MNLMIGGMVIWDGFVEEREAENNIIITSKHEIV